MKKLTALFLMAASMCMAQSERFGLSVEPPQGGRLAVEFSMLDKHYIYADQLQVAVDGTVLTPSEGASPVTKPDPVTGDDVSVFEGRARFVYTVNSAAPGYSVKVSWLGCNDKECFLPMEKEFSFGATTPSEAVAKTPVPEAGAVLDGFAAVGSASGYLKEAEFIAFLDASLSGKADSGSGFGGKGIAATLLLILLGGLALNLTPCVLPMIPINIAIIGAGVGAGTKSRGFLLGAAYGAGIALVYGALGLVVMLTGSTFGTLNSSPWFNFSVAAVFVVLALSMFGVFNIDLSRFQGKISTGGQDRGRIAVSFFLGGVAALLAGACVAPVVISVLLLSADLYQKGQFAGLLLPFVLGLGMALPWPFAGAGVSFLPKPGAWMEKIKYAFGAIILIGAGYYALLGASLIQDRSEDKRMETESAQQERIKEGWYTDLDPALAAARTNGQPVFIDFWASWCKNCLKMEKTTFQDEAVKQKLNGFVKVKYRAENPKDPETKKMLDNFGIVGLPTYIVLMPVSPE